MYIFFFQSKYPGIELFTQGFCGGNVMSEEIHKLSLTKIYFSSRNSSYIDVFVFVLSMQNKTAGEFRHYHKSLKSHTTSDNPRIFGKRLPI